MSDEVPVPKDLEGLLPTNEEADELCRQLCLATHKYFLEEEDCKDFCPKVGVVGRKMDEDGGVGEEDQIIAVMMVGVDFNSGEQKREAFFQLGARLRAARVLPRMIFMVSEAWTAPAPKNPEEMKVMPREHPERREVIMHNVCSARAFYSPCQVLSITRDADDNIIPGEAEPLQGAVGGGSLLSHFFRGWVSVNEGGQSESSDDGE